MKRLHEDVERFEHAERLLLEREPGNLLAIEAVRADLRRALIRVHMHLRFKETND